MRRRLVRVQKLILAIPVVFSFVAGSDARIPESQRLLAAADRFAMLFNWPKAAPLYVKAESLFLRANDRSRFLSARLGYIWVTADAGIAPSAVEEVAEYLEDSAVRSDPRLLLKALVA